MKLVVFDLDGTLTATSAVDETCFVQAFADSLNIHRLSTNWLDYDHATDTAVARQAFLKQFGREPESTGNIESGRAICRIAEPPS